METFLLIIGISIMNICAFFVGAKVGQKVQNDETIELPKVKTFKEIHEEKLSRQREEEEKQKLDIILQNIENYDGTDFRQQDVPM